MGLGEPPDYPPSQRLADKHEGRALSRLFQGGTKFRSFLCKRPRRRSGIAPSEAGAIVAAHARRIRKGCLHQGPVHGKPTASNTENDCRTTSVACPRAEEMQAVSSKIDQPSRREAVAWRLRVGHA